MNQNPLEHYFRQPKIYITLPSLGVYSPENAFTGPVENIAVYGMTGMDEIIIKTPDALMSGESSIKIIESCCPTIKTARALASIDMPLLFAAIRIATYGNTMRVGHTCPKCSHFNEYELDLTTVIEFFSGKKYNNRIVINDLVIKVRPITYQQTIELNIRNYRSRQKLAQIEKIEDDEVKQEELKKLWTEFTDIQLQLYKQSTDSIETPTTTVTERGYIEEWLDNCDTLYTTKIKEHLQELKTQWGLPAYQVICDNCQAPISINIDLDYSNFFSWA